MSIIREDAGKINGKIPGAGLAKDYNAYAVTPTEIWQAQRVSRFEADRKDCVPVAAIPR